MLEGMDVVLATATHPGHASPPRSRRDAAYAWEEEFLTRPAGGPCGAIARLRGVCEVNEAARRGRRRRAHGRTSSVRDAIRTGLEAWRPLGPPVPLLKLVCTVPRRDCLPRWRDLSLRSVRRPTTVGAWRQVQVEEG